MGLIERDDETERERILREHRDQWRAISAEQQADYGELQAERDRLAAQLAGAVDHMRESRIARARGLAQAISECRDDARLDGVREGAAEIVALLSSP
jgi:hypothetical protein